MRRPTKADLMPWLARALSSTGARNPRRCIYSARARVRGETDLVLAFVNPRDPFGLPLLQALAQLQKRFMVRFQLHTVWQLDEEMYPEPELWRLWAQQDATRISTLYNLDPPDRPTLPSQNEFLTAVVRLLEAEQADDGLLSAARTMSDLWGKNGHNASDTEFSEHQQQTLAENEQKLRRLGHYQGSMTYYLGEWFWGVDRLDHLERSLIAQGLNRGDSVDIVFNRTRTGVGCTSAGLPEDHPASDIPLEVFFSIRSPYSYLGLERAITLARNWNIPLRLRPVLPMLMRGQSVPDAKKWYIFHDTKREALKLGIPYGFVADPLGPGVERCYALFEYARSLGREIEYMRSYARAVNAEGIRSETDTGLRTIVERAGLDWPKAKALLADQSWREWAEDNRKAMYGCGLWGVPSFRYGPVSCWGQDRLWLIDDEIKKSGDESGAPSR